MKLFDALYVTYMVTDGMPDSVRREKMNMVASSFTGNDEPAVPKEQPEPNFATAWDDAAIDSIKLKCLRFALQDFDLSKLDEHCSKCGSNSRESKQDALVSEIRGLVKSVLLKQPEYHCSNFILNRFEQSIVRSIAVAHRDYDHWNDK